MGRCRLIAVFVALACTFGAVPGASPARALSFNWDFSTSNLVTSTGGTNWGNSLTFSAVGAPTERVVVRAYSPSGTDSGSFTTAYVGVYSGGLGVSNRTESPTPPASSPNHAIDNNGRDDYLLLEFDSPSHNLTGLEIGWRYTDSDVQVWVGGPSSAGLDLTTACGGACTPSSLAGLGFVPLSVVNNLALGTMLSVSTQISGRYVLIAGAQGQVDDYFKVDAARTNEVTQAPEPSTLAVLGTVGLGLLLRRRRRG